MAAKSQRPAPLSHHPLFPTVVALWFAALLGLGSLAIRASVLERIVLATHLDLIVPAAAPPLGFTAQMLLALLLTFGGGLTGYLLARRLAAAPQSRQRAPAVVVPRAKTGTSANENPITFDATDDDGEDFARLDAARSAQPRRRRVLTSEDSAAPQAPLEVAPLPGKSPPMLMRDDLASLPPLGPVLPETGPETSIQLSPEATVAAFDAAQLGEGMDVAGPAPVAEPLGTASLDEGDASPQARSIPAALAPLPLAARAPSDASAAERLRRAPLDELGTVELIERFALALAARSAATGGRAQRPAEARSPQSAEPERLFDMPEALRTPGLGNDFEAAGQQAPAFARPAATALADELDDEASEEPPFSSLLDMKPPARTALRGEVLSPAPELGPVRPIGHPGGATAPTLGAFRPPLAANASDPAETERELREALAALQRMSGAA